MSKRHMHRYKISEISPVDRPAQKGALKVIIKQESGEELAKLTFNEALEGLELAEAVNHAMMDMWQLNDALRMSIQGIIANKEEYPDTLGAVRASLSQFASAVSSMVAEAVGEVEEEMQKTEGGKVFSAEDYAYAPDLKKSSTWQLRLTNEPGGIPDPILVGATVAAMGPDLRGNKVLIPQEDRANVVSKVKLAWLKANFDKLEEDLPEVLKSQEEVMSNKPTPTVEELQARLEIAEAFGKLNDSEKVHYNGLDDTGKAAFLKMEAATRLTEISKKAESDPIVYTATDGTVFRKSHGDQLVSLAKRADAAEKKSREDAEIAKNHEFRKRAETEIRYLPGTDDAKIALLKAVDSISDKSTKDAVTEILKSHNATFAPAYQTLGAGNGAAMSEPAQKLQVLAKQYQETHKELTYEQAYSEVCKTAEGKQLYTQTLS